MKLELRRLPDGVEFRLAGPSGCLPPEEWALVDSVHLPGGATARVGVLLRLLEDEQADQRGEAIFLPHRSVAALDDAERRQTGLPRSCRCAVELRASGAFADPDFSIERRLLNPDGRPVVAPELQGCFLRVGGEELILAEPLYSLWESVGRFNAGPGSDIEERLRAWAEIAQHLPSEVRLGEELERVRFVLATGFSLNPFRNERGEPDADPVLGRWTEHREGLSDPVRAFDDKVLPTARQRDFAARFRSLSDVKHRYGLGAGNFVVLSPRLERALRVVREVQKSDAGTRRRFLTRPSAFLRDALEEGVEPEGAALEEAWVDEVFFDEGLSDRVKGIGIWEPKVLPWLKASGEQWLPEDAGLQIDDRRVPVPPEKAPALLEEVRKARAEGRETIDFGGEQIPATEATEKALLELIEATGAVGKPPEGTRPTPTQKIAVLIIDNLEQLGFRMEPRGQRSPAERLPSDLATMLLPHQDAGLRWLLDHWASGSPGALLADDMGLGKTLQALAFLSCVREEMAAERWPTRPFLVVAPTGLLRNWRDEHDKHLDSAGLGVLVEAFGGGLRNLRTARDAEGRELATGLPSLDVAALGRADWVMTTYETLRDYQHSFARIHWAVAVFDEAQKIKNPAAGLTDAAKAMKQDFTLILTGTPVENRIEDLWCIVDTARPGQLGALKDFSAHFRTAPSEAGGRFADLRKQLSEGTPPSIMIRRLKEDHLEGLPSKEIHVETRSMPTPQANAYREAVASARHGDAPILQALQRIRSISLHPLVGEIAADDAFISQSARVALAFEILDRIRTRGEKVLVFLESRAVQDALAEILQRRYRLRDRILIINGDVAGPRRKGRVDEFQKRPGFDVMLLSPRAGGVGLTLTAANHVIHLARWWNPAVEDQCTDRVYRIGQERPVHVYHVLAVHPDLRDHSFDVRLASLLDRKRQLNRTVLAPPGATNSELEDLYRDTVGSDGSA